MVVRKLLPYLIELVSKWQRVKVQFINGWWCLVAGGVDQVRLEGDPGDPHSPGGAQQSTVGHTQRPQHVETARQQCTEERLGNVHVPDQHRPHAITGNNQQRSRFHFGNIVF